MADMRVSGEEQKNFVTPKPEVPTYPHGLKISLEKEQLDRLGFLNAPGVGEKYAIMGLVEVVTVRSGEDNANSDGFSIELQITDLTLKSEESPKEKVSALFHGE